MPQNKRESLIYSVMMCFTMVLWMSIYNMSLQMGALSIESIKAAWIGFPLTFVLAFCIEWFVVSTLAKRIAFRFFLTHESSVMKKQIVISCCMIVPMVLIMSLYGAMHGVAQSGAWGNLGLMWLSNLPKNFVMALPFQLLIAGPLVRKIFRTTFPVGTVLA